ncbi:MAG TPA: cupredoxin domain-containing protein, partial [Actinomycetota bacterium]|nr:cupredoxin domain-containing protein [Actinomycetota bacterium]
SVVFTYRTATEVHVATGDGTGAWQTATVAALGEGADGPGGTGVAVDGSGGIVAAWYDPAAKGVSAALSSDGQTFTPIDLGLTEGAKDPAVATTADGSARFIAWYDSEPQDLVLGRYGQVGDLAIGVPSPTPTAAGGASAPPPTQECTPVQGGKVTVVAEGLAFTDGSCIDAPAGEPFTIVFDNRDAGVQHNVEVFGGAEVSGDPQFSGDIITGPDQVEYQIPALDKGEYAFNCVVHPTMIGKIVVGGAGGATGATGGTGAAGPTGATGGGGGGGGGAVTTTVVAQNLAFDTSTITLKADTQQIITFDNRDAGVQHNIAIYTDSSMTKELFSGELVTGAATADYTIPSLPAGEYYFLCIVHPNMNGTVVVQ